MSHSSRQTEPDASLLAAELRLLIGKLRRRLRHEMPPMNLSWPQIAVLGHLDRDGPMTISALARAEGVRPQSMGATVATLESAGLISGSPNPEDGRQTIVQITPASHHLVREMRSMRDRWLRDAMLARLNPDELSQLATAMPLLERLAAP